MIEGFHQMHKFFEDSMRSGAFLMAFSGRPQNWRFEFFGRVEASELEAVTIAVKGNKSPTHFRLGGANLIPGHSRLGDFWEVHYSSGISWLFRRPVSPFPH